MTDQKKEEPKKTGAAKDRFQAEFEALPLEQKIARLMRMEVVTISETFAYMVNSPMKVVEKFGDVISEFGTKIENEVKKATSSHSAKSKSGAAKGPAAKPKGSASRKSAAPRTPKT